MLQKLSQQVPSSEFSNLKLLVGKPDMVGASGGRRIRMVLESCTLHKRSFFNAWWSFYPKPLWTHNFPYKMLFYPKLYERWMHIPPFFENKMISTWIASWKKLFKAEQVTFIWLRLTATLILAMSNSNIYINSTMLMITILYLLSKYFANTWLLKLFSIHPAQQQQGPGGSKYSCHHHFS